MTALFEAVVVEMQSQSSAAVAANASALAKPEMALVSATSTLNTNKLTWVVDTGAASHMCKATDLFVRLESIELRMEPVVNSLRILEKVCELLSKTTNIVKYVPRVIHNLFSVVNTSVNAGFGTVINKRECTLETDMYYLPPPPGGGVDL
ncbi:hypothetical protein PR003_g15522 [Phytophthora rubi]|uniref:Retrovirus-related Pol polyprotein from transposon TNT 1-94-like beta-barrel domain-containing protein n=1 Tax=Phytophthora rubi TaxID=129364 RepID=A0A6A4EYM1_9STRA|nr:hypothetical protein PR003_g15522 [Phytophthora rubi]